MTEPNYKLQYEQLIETARVESVKYVRGFEIHHILPRCLGGGDEFSNLVRLWPKEHLRAHWLLSKYLVGSERLAMERVFEKMLMGREWQDIDKWLYRSDAIQDAETFGALPSNKAWRREGLSRAATKFLASEQTRKGRRPLSKH